LKEEFDSSIEKGYTNKGIVLPESKVASSDDNNLEFEILID
jgi:hypothetical protein